MLPQILFTLTALGGAVVASFPLMQKRNPPTWLALGHGAVGVLSFITLFYALATTGITTTAQIALVILILAALGGATMFLGFHLRNRPLPSWLVIGHGLAGLAGVVTLWAGR